MMDKPAPANTRSKTFRAWARDISQAVKQKRDFGRSVDINGEMARAMERAYQQGFEDRASGRNPLGESKVTGKPRKPNAATDPNDPTPLDRDDISDKIHGAFYSICLHKWGLREHEHETPKTAVYMQDEVSYDFGKEPRWRLIAHSKSHDEKGLAHRTLMQLVKIGLLYEVEIDHDAFRTRNLLALSPKGDATYHYHNKLTEQRRRARQGY
ncbi:hypothetical protein ACGYLO_17840 [Sulfitobacter sp. 1A13353]|uniref:hypothetical protein n=1 Tax=Sulfitobacter sp. 1A13353 TaxID=3368568 RepID=UPI003745DF68